MIDAKILDHLKINTLTIASSQLNYSFNITDCIFLDAPPKINRRTKIICVKNFNMTNFDISRISFTNTSIYFGEDKIYIMTNKNKLNTNILLYELFGENIKYLDISVITNVKKFMCIL